MRSQKYQKYLKEVSNQYDLVETEVMGLFFSAIARAYDAIGSAYVWDDGTISLAVDQNSNKSLVIKDYVISSKQYDKITKIFVQLVERYSKQRDELYFLQKIKGKIIQAKISKDLGDKYSLLPIFDLGGIRNFQFLLPKSKVFSGDDLSIGSKIFVMCHGLKKYQEHFVECTRFDKKICGAIFVDEFNKLLRILNEKYCYENFSPILNHSSKEVIFLIEWKVLANGFFISELNKRLNLRIGKCLIRLKKSSKKGDGRWSD